MIYVLCATFGAVGWMLDWSCVLCVVCCVWKLDCASDKQQLKWGKVQREHEDKINEGKEGKK